MIPTPPRRNLLLQTALTTQQCLTLGSHDSFTGCRRPVPISGKCTGCEQSNGCFGRCLYIRKSYDEEEARRFESGKPSQLCIVSMDKFALQAFNRLVDDREISQPLAANMLLRLPEYDAKRAWRAGFYSLLPFDQNHCGCSFLLPQFSPIITFSNSRSTRTKKARL